MPVLLVERDRLPQTTVDALDPTADITVVGGPGAVSEAVVSALDSQAGTVRRLAGGDRYATARAVADEAATRSADPRTLWLATGDAFPDGLAAGAAVGASGGMLLLAGDGAAAEPALDWMAAHRSGLRRVYLAGGTAALSDTVEDRTRTALE